MSASTSISPFSLTVQDLSDLTSSAAALQVIPGKPNDLLITLRANQDLYLGGGSRPTKESQIGEGDPTSFYIDFSHLLDHATLERLASQIAVPATNSEPQGESFSPPEVFAPNERFAFVELTSDRQFYIERGASFFARLTLNDPAHKTTTLFSTDDGVVDIYWDWDPSQQLSLIHI